MATWHCPHCGAPQPEAARCWVCRRSSTVCATCRHVRRAIAGGLVYCGKDPRRSPLRGDEIRPCWEAAVGAGRPSTGVEPAVASASGRARVAFVAVEAVEAVEAAEVVDEGGASGAGRRRDVPSIPAGQRVGTLWADLDP